MQIRYTSDADGLKATAVVVLSDFGSGGFASAIALHKGFGNPSHKKGDHLRSRFDVRYCKNCGMHWVKFAVEQQGGENWKEVAGLSATRFTDTVVNL
jgi:hypothetical protein